MVAALAELNFLCRAGVTGNQRLTFVRHTAAPGAGHRAIDQHIIWSMHGNDIEKPGAYRTTNTPGYIQ